MEYMFMPLKRYADFSGRSRRKEYWMFVLFLTVVYVVLYTFMLGGMLSASSSGQVGAGFGVSMILLVLFALAMFVPALAVQVRRFHDQDKSGWMVLLNLIPLGGLVVLVFMCMEGTRGPNRYGPDPKGDTSRVFA